MLEQLGELRTVDVVLPTRDGHEIRQRFITKPTDQQAILLHHLGLKLPSKLNATELS